MANRRIIDNVLVTALTEANDTDMLKRMCELYGTGTLVEDCLTNKVYFNKSDFGLSDKTLTKQINALRETINPSSVDCYVTTSDGISHKVNSNVISIMITVLLYSMICNKTLSTCLLRVLDEINSIVSNLKVSNLNTYIEVIDDSLSISNNDKLYSYCRSEVFKMLERYGVNLVK